MEVFSGKLWLLINPDNGQHTGTGLRKIEGRIGDEDWA